MSGSHKQLHKCGMWQILLAHDKYSVINIMGIYAQIHKSSNIFIPTTEWTLSVYYSFMSIVDIKVTFIYFQQSWGGKFIYTLQ